MFNAKIVTRLLDWRVARISKVITAE